MIGYILKVKMEVLQRRGGCSKLYGTPPSLQHPCPLALGLCTICHCVMIWLNMIQMD